MLQELAAQMAANPRPSDEEVEVFSGSLKLHHVRDWMTAVATLKGIYESDWGVAVATTLVAFAKDVGSFLRECSYTVGSRELFVQFLEVLYKGVGIWTWS